MKKHLFTLSIATLCLFSAKAQYFTKWATYPTGYKMNAALKTNIFPGFLTIGHVPVPHNAPNWPSYNSNFYVERQIISQVGTSSSAYQVHVANNCNGNGTFTQLSNCSGVDIIETSAAQGVNYAVAGSSSDGCFYVTMNSLMTPASPKKWFPFPSPSQIPTVKPLIREDHKSGNYFICGSYDHNMFLLNINNSGNILWSSFYHLPNMPGNLRPADMLVDMRQGSDGLIIVGNVESGGTSDGFFMHLNAQGGQVISFSTYNGAFPNSSEQFNTVIKVQPFHLDEFMIGGISDPVSGSGSSLLLRVNISGNVLWSHLYTAHHDSQVKGIVSVVERMNTSNTLEYFAAASSTAGIIVYKLDNTGLPLTNGQHNEFAYNLAGAQPSSPVAVTSKNGSMSDPWTGIQVFGTAYNFPGWDESYMTTAYYNGITNCYGSYNNVQNVEILPLQRHDPNLGIHGQLSACNQVQLFWYPAAMFNMPCSGLLNGGNNQRPMVTGLHGNYQEVRDQVQISVFPNPAESQIHISMELENATRVKIDVFNLAGQKVATLSDEKTLPGPYSKQFQIGEAGLSNGVYFLSVSHDGFSSRQKLVINSH